jgi:hypothetical protein
VCDKCLKKKSKLKRDESTKQKDNDSNSDEIEQSAKITAMQYLNESLQSIGESPIKKKKSRRGQVPYKENEKN